MTERTKIERVDGHLLIGESAIPIERMRVSFSEADFVQCPICRHKTWRYAINDALGLDEPYAGDALERAVKCIHGLRDLAARANVALGDDENGLAKVFGSWPGDESDEELLDAIRDMDEPGQSVLHAALRRYGFKEQLAMLQEECGELVAAVNRYRRGRAGAFEAMIEEIADVEILIDQMRLVYGAEIDAARARKLARLKERLGR